MESLIVHATHNGKHLGSGFPVLLNGDKSGITGVPVLVQSGVVLVSIDVASAVEQEVRVVDTTAQHPMEVCIEIADLSDIGVGAGVSENA